MKDILIGMEDYAIHHNVPIITKDSIAFIMKYIKLNKIRYFELGSTIGYSAILMAISTRYLSNYYLKMKIDI